MGKKLGRIKQHNLDSAILEVLDRIPGNGDILQLFSLSEDNTLLFNGIPLGVSKGFKIYDNGYITLEQNTTSVPIDTIKEDIYAMIHVEGLLLDLGKEYTINTANKSIDFTEMLNAGETVSYTLFDNSDSGGGSGTGDGIEIITQDQLTNDLTPGFYYLQNEDLSKTPLWVAIDPDNTYKKNAIKIDKSGLSSINLSTGTSTSYKHSSITKGTVGLRNGNKYIILTDNESKEILIDVSSIETGGGTYNVMFTTKKPVNNPIGSFQLGDVVTESDAMSINDALNMLLYKDIPPTFEFTATDSGLVEKGNIVAAPTYTCKISDVGTGTVSSVVFYKNNAVVSTQAYELNKTYTYQETTNITETTTIKCTVIFKYTGDTQNRYSSKELSYTFVPPSYYGIIDDRAITTDILATLNKTVKTSKLLVYSGIEMQNQYVCYIYPQKYGTLTSILDGNNFEYIRSFDVIGITLNGENYYAYVLLETASYDNGKLTFS